MADDLTIDFIDQKPAQPQGLQIDFLDQPTRPRTASGISEAWQAGWQGSIPGLVDRGKLPDIVLDAHHSKWYEKLAASASQMIHETPESIAGAVVGAKGGAVVGGLAGSVIPGAGTAGGAAVGGLLGGGAGAFALPTAIREGLVQYYQSQGRDASSADFLMRAGIVIKATAKDALIGAATAGAGSVAGKLTAGSTSLVRGAAVTGSELTALTVAPAALEGKLPEPEDFLNAAILLGGMKGATTAASRLMRTYAEIGRRPEEVVADAQKDPTIVEDLTAQREVPKAGEQLELFSEIPRAYQGEALANSIRDIVPGEKAQKVAAEPFGPVKQAAGEPASPTEVNYNYIHTTEEAKGALASLSAHYEAEIQAQRRGTVSWDQTQAEAGKYVADLLGSTEPFQPREPGTAAGAAELLARKQMLQGAAEDMAVKARAFLDTPADQRTPLQTAEYLASIERAAMIQAEFLGARAEAGRALNILKETKVAADRAKQIDELLKRYGHSPEELAKMIAEIDNPTAALKFAKEASKATTWDKVVEAWKAGLVSGPITQVANIMGNLSFAALRPAVDAVAVVTSPFVRGAEKVHAVEPLARVLGNIQGTWDGMKMARVAFIEEGSAAAKTDQYRQAIGGKLGYAVRTPFRALGAMDALFRAMAEQGEVNAIAARQAAKEGYNPATREFRERMAEISQNLTPEQAQQVASVGERLTFQAPLGEKGRAVQNFVRQWHLEWAVPFITTPTNVFKEMARHSPLAPIVGEWRAAIAKGGPEAQRAFAEMTVGTGISVMATSWALSGNITGSGDPDPNKRRAQMAAGWQPYSLKIGDTWYSYQRIQPLGTLLGMASDMAQAWEHLTPEESDKLPKILATAFANAVTNQTFLSGMTNLVQVMADPERYGPKFLQSMAGSVVPGAVGQTAQLMDPYQREIDSMKEAVQNRIPGLREKLSPTRDMFGEKVESPDRLGGVSPITTKQMSDDPVRKEALRLGVGMPEAPKAIELAGGKIDSKISKVQLTQEQRDIFGDVAGHTAYQIMAPMVASPGWAWMPDAVKKVAFKEVFEKSRLVGKSQALTPEQRQAEITRITDEIGKRLQPPAAQ